MVILIREGEPLVPAENSHVDIAVRVKRLEEANVQIIQSIARLEHKFDEMSAELSPMLESLDTTLAGDAALRAQLTAMSNIASSIASKLMYIVSCSTRLIWLTGGSS
jgi:hypothetical protein